MDKKIKCPGCGKTAKKIKINNETITICCARKKCNYLNRKLHN